MFFPVFNLNYLVYMLPALILSMIAQFYVNSRYSRWSQVPNHSGLNGAQVAQRLADRMGLYGMQLKGTAGKLTDHYDPSRNILSLSQDIAQTSSVASMAITAHELGHAQQDQEDYLPHAAAFRNGPGGQHRHNRGLDFHYAGPAPAVQRPSPGLGVIAFSAGAIFSIATLPVELNASRRAKQLLKTNGLVTTAEEEQGVNQVLNAAAMTYVAAVATSVLQLMYFASMVGGRRRR